MDKAILAKWLVWLTYFKALGSVYLSRLNLQQCVWYLGKAEPMWCGYSP